MQRSALTLPEASRASLYRGDPNAREAPFKTPPPLKDFVLIIENDRGRIHATPVRGGFFEVIVGASDNDNIHHPWLPPRKLKAFTDALLWSAHAAGSKGVTVKLATPTAARRTASVAEADGASADGAASEPDRVTGDCVLCVEMIYAMPISINFDEGGTGTPTRRPGWWCLYGIGVKRQFMANLLYAVWGRRRKGGGVTVTLVPITLPTSPPTP